MTDLARLAIPTASPAAPTGLGDGEVTVTERFVAERGIPRVLVSGEIHFSRVPRASWPAVLAAARAGGVTHVATYVLWNHHEPERGAPSFEGDLDLRAFLDLARAEGLGIVLRIGPYAHAETRHGGLPDWLVESGLPVRTDDPRYLAQAERWYRAIAAEVAGVPLFAIQVDNELYDRPEHLASLRRIAEESGLTAPLWTATAWGAAAVPEGILGVYGGYPDSFWIEAGELRDLRSESNFTPSPVRDDDGIGADHRGEVDAAGAAVGTSGAQPFVTCELGGGMISAYHRRPDVGARDIEALALAKLASGSVWQGYYMYADGRNPRRGLQESHALGEPNDFMELSYDFGAPLTVDGMPRESWFRLRRQHLMLERWGSAVAAMPAVFPATLGDADALRWSVRSDGAGGFVFVANRQPGVVLSARAGAGIHLDLPAGPIEFPVVDVPAETAFAWPFGLPLGAVTIAWATAQAVTEVQWRGMPLLVLAATPGVEARFAVDGDASAEPLAQAGPGRWWQVRRDGAAVAHLLVLEEEESLTAAIEAGRLVLAAGVVAHGEAVLWTAGSVRVLDDEGWRVAGTVDAAPSRPIAVRASRPAGGAPAWRTAGNGRASIPREWSAAAEAVLEVADLAADETVVIEWEGDLARAWDGDRLVSDAVYCGRPWRIGPAERAGAAALRVEILPLAADAPVLVCAGAPTATALHAAAAHRPVRVALT
ncbi:beta-galactosidase [Microbacterium hominis]|uniref:Beta-galactosidase n=1 Tax=Microbacterium hominis TaxID=162426 RepID=A0A7D4U718_9MICO|nr:beta-galactosidase [Microbacterium hominis]QKJ18886.1 beta-galactosidase [Microbacterium hominis]